MNTVIQQKIESIESINQRMNDVVSKTISSILNELLHSASSSTSEQNDINTSSASLSFNTIGIVSGAALLVGSLGWVICSASDVKALWPKVLFWGGGIGLTLDYIMKKNKRSKMPSPEVKSLPYDSVSAIKHSASSKIISTIEKISSLWDNLTRANKEQLLSLIDNSTLSSNDKFNASSFISVTKTLDFELLKIQNMIDDAKTIMELTDNLSKIHNSLKDKIDEVSNLQIESYRQVDQILMGE